MRPGTEHEERLEKGKKLLVIKSDPEEKEVWVDKDAVIDVRRTPAIPQAYRDPKSSGLSFEVPAQVTEKNFELTGSGAPPAAE